MREEAQVLWLALENMVMRAGTSTMHADDGIPFGHSRTCFWCWSENTRAKRTSAIWAGLEISLFFGIIAPWTTQGPLHINILSADAIIATEPLKLENETSFANHYKWFLLLRAVVLLRGCRCPWFAGWRAAKHFPKIWLILQDWAGVMGDRDQFWSLPLTKPTGWRAPESCSPPKIPCFWQRCQIFEFLTSVYRTNKKKLDTRLRPLQVRPLSGDLIACAKFPCCFPQLRDDHRAD